MTNHQELKTLSAPLPIDINLYHQALGINFLNMYLPAVEGSQLRCIDKPIPLTDKNPAGISTQRWAWIMGPGRKIEGYMRVTTGYEINPGHLPVVKTELYDGFRNLALISTVCTDTQTGAMAELIQDGSGRRRRAIQIDCRQGVARVNDYDFEGNFIRGAESTIDFDPGSIASSPKLMVTNRQICEEFADKNLLSAIREMQSKVLAMRRTSPLVGYPWNLKSLTEWEVTQADCQGVKLAFTDEGTEEDHKWEIYFPPDRDNNCSLSRGIYRSGKRMCRETIWFHPKKAPWTYEITHYGDNSSFLFLEGVADGTVTSIRWKAANGEVMRVDLTEAREGICPFPDIKEFGGLINERTLNHIIRHKLSLAKTAGVMVNERQGQSLRFANKPARRVVSEQIASPDTLKEQLISTLNNASLTLGIKPGDWELVDPRGINGIWRTLNLANNISVEQIINPTERGYLITVNYKSSGEIKKIEQVGFDHKMGMFSYRAKCLDPAGEFQLWIDQSRGGQIVNYSFDSSGIGYGADSLAALEKALQRPSLDRLMPELRKLSAALFGPSGLEALSTRGVDIPASLKNMLDNPSEQSSLVAKPVAETAS